MNQFIKELAKQLATQINKSINIPWLNEEQEQMFFELVVTKVLELVLGHILTNFEVADEKNQGKMA